MAGPASTVVIPAPARLADDMVARGLDTLTSDKLQDLRHSTSIPPHPYTTPNTSRHLSECDDQFHLSIVEAKRCSGAVSAYTGTFDEPPFSLACFKRQGGKGSGRDRLSAKALRAQSRDEMAFDSNLPATYSRKSWRRRFRPDPRQ